MFGKLAKSVKRIFTPKHGLRATRKKYLPKVAGGVALIGGGVALDKTLNAIEGTQDTYVEYGNDPNNLVDKSWNLLKLEDVQNGGRTTGFGLGPASLSTWVLAALFFFATLYPSWILFKSAKRCFLTNCLLGVGQTLDMNTMFEVF